MERERGERSEEAQNEGKRRRWRGEEGGGRTVSDKEQGKRVGGVGQIK